MTTLTQPVVSEQKPETIYNRVFWFSYAANTALVTANALQFRFAEFVKFLGGTEHLTGTIVSTGLVAAIIMRLKLGQEIDRFGTRKLWATSAVLFMLACAIFLLTTHLSWQIYAARIAFSVGLAGMFTCSIVYIQDQVPTHRRTEVIGILGTSGFIGMIIGSLVGDLILNTVSVGRPQFLVLFGGAMALGLFYFAVVIYLTQHDGHHESRESPPVHQLLKRYWPGMVLLVAVMMGIGITVTTVFLTRFATERNLSGIGTFFTAYSASAFACRFATRHWSRTIGRHRMILWGLTGHCVGHALLPTVTAEWHFVLPSIACGLGHALLFPAVISLGSGSFPRKYRGTGTTIVLGFTEIGVVLFAPALGWIIDHHGFVAMFYTSSGLAFVVGSIYAATAGRTFDNDTQHNESDGSSIITHRRIDEEHGLEEDEEEQVDERRRGLGSDSVSAPFPHIGRN